MICKQLKNGKYPLILLHGWGLNSAVWQLVAEDLAEYFDVHCIDLPGFGVNHQMAPEPYDLDALVDLVEPLCPENSLILGWSLGGMVATRMATRFSHKVAAMCLVASSPCFVEQSDWRAVKPDVLDGFSQSLLEDSQKTIERFLAIQTIGSPSAKQDIKWLKQSLQDYPPAAESALIGGLTLLQQLDLRQELKQLSLPITGIYGQLDALVPIKSVLNFAKTMENFSVEVVKKASHAPFISHREAFVRQVIASYGDFL